LEEPQILQHPLVPLKENNLNLTCSVVSNLPVTYTWMKQEKIIGNQPLLILDSLTTEDNGNYFCKARTKLQEKVTSATIELQCKSY
jgi:Immunoglobulin domain.